MRVPFDLRAPLPPDDQNCEFIELRRDRSWPAQIIKQIEQPLAEHRAAYHRIVRSAEADAGNLHDLLAERLLLLVGLVPGQLRKTRLLSGRGLRENRGGKPAAGRGNRERRNPDRGRVHDFLRFVLIGEEMLFQRYLARQPDDRISAAQIAPISPRHSSASFMRSAL